MTKASKYGLRAAAAERSKKHAQRTPLPPRPGVVEAAREVITSIDPGKTTGVAVQHAHEVLAEVAEHKAKASRLDATASDAKSWGKVRGFQEKAVAAGWDHSIDARGDAVEITVTRGPETIVQAWRNGVWQYDASVYAFADRTTKPRNASGASKLLDREPEEAAAEATKVASNNSFRKRTPTDLAPIALPLDPELLTDEEAAKFFRGQTVRWFNRMSRSTETAMVSRSSVVRVTRWEGETTVSFCCPVTGFRAFHLSAVLAVGRGKSGITAGSKTATVELEEVA
jgi:hypothetical protein